MTYQIRCVQCKVLHKATSRNFPLARKEQRPDDKGVLHPEIIGYLCRWCIKKHIKKEEERRATIKLSNESATKALPSKGQNGRGDRNTGTDVQSRSKNNLWGRAGHFIGKLRGTVLQNHDQPRIPPKQPDTGKRG